MALDSSNGEALAKKSLLSILPTTSNRKSCSNRAMAARPLDAGASTSFTGLSSKMSAATADAAGNSARAVDMLALDGSSQFGSADALLVAGKPDEAKPHFAAVDRSRQDPQAGAFVAVIEATENGDYRRPSRPCRCETGDPGASRAAFLSGFQGHGSAGSSRRNTQAVRMLVALPRDQQDAWTLKLLAALGAHREALQAVRTAGGLTRGLGLDLWYPSMRPTLGDPRFSALLQRLRLIDYWRTTHSQARRLRGKSSPPFCRMI